MTYKYRIGRDTFTIEDAPDHKTALDRAMNWWLEEGGDPEAKVILLNPHDATEHPKAD